MMTFKRILPALLFFHTPIIQAIDKTVNPELNSRLKLAATTFDRHTILNKDESWTYDFNNAVPSDAWKPGSVKNANAATFPALTGIGMTLAQLNLGPCAMLPPHYHQRATNLVVAITGNTTSHMVNENGVRRVTVNLTPGIMTIFPKGSLHTMQNNGCENAFLISALDSEDTGTLNILNGLWAMPHDMVRAGFGDTGINVDSLGRSIPEMGYGAAMGSAECMARCGITHGKQ